jgi:ribosomal-protein-alanine N-acetyltransferase
MTVVEVEVRRATALDARAVSELERTALGRDAWSERLVAEGVSGRVPSVVYLVATVGETVTGYAAASIVANIGELQRIAVGAAHRRTGIASTLLAHVEREAAAHHADRILLEVREDNSGACAFYADRGFAEIDRRPRYYADGSTAVILVKELP